MERHGLEQTITATNSASTSGRFEMRGLAFGGVKVPSSVTAIAWYAAADRTSTPTAVRDKDGNAVTSTTTAGDWTPIPDECMGMPYLVPVLTGSSSASMTGFFKS